MMKVILQKTLLVFIVIVSICCYYHLNYGIQNAPSESLLTNIEYVKELVGKEDKIKDFLIVVLNSFVQYGI